ncbi:hypothetical protein [Pseudonocardia alni]|uniref:hypothetical protein n=1 Tax=Pseudonocardia alni TaxID=33907 RepID=UPI003321A6DD
MAYRTAKVWTGSGWDDLADPRITSLVTRTETIENSRGAASGLATLDGNSRVPTTQLPAGQASGVASLDSNSRVPIAQIPTGTTSSTVALGNDSRITGAEQTANRNATNGYAGLNGAGQIQTWATPSVLGTVQALSYSTANTYSVGLTSNLVDITLTASITFNPLIGSNHQRTYLHVLASGAARTFTLGVNVLESPGFPSSYTIPSGQVLTFELECTTLRGTSAWLLTRVINGDSALDPMPRGLVARRQRTSNTGLSTSTTPAGIMWVRCNVYAGRSYRVRSDGIALAGAASVVSGHRFNYTTDGSTPTTSSTALETGYWHFAVSSQSSSWFHTGLYLPTTDHTFSVLLSFWRVTGSGSVTYQGSTASPMGMIVEDLGIAPAVTGADI